MHFQCGKSTGRRAVQKCNLCYADSCGIYKSIFTILVMNLKFMERSHSNNSLVTEQLKNKHNLLHLRFKRTTKVKKAVQSLMKRWERQYIAGVSSADETDVGKGLAYQAGIIPLT